MQTKLIWNIFGVVIVAALSACAPQLKQGQIDAPSVDHSREGVDPVTVGYRLMAVGENQLALDTFERAAVKAGLTADLLNSMGMANLRLGRVHQAKSLFERAVSKNESSPEIWNNLAIATMDLGQTAEAAAIFRKAYALSNGENDSIRNNLRLALEKIENPVYDASLEQEYKLVRQGSSEYLIQTAL